MRPFTVAMAAMLLMTGSAAAADKAKKKSSTKAYFNPKELTIDKPVPWQPAKKSAKKTTPIRELGQDGFVEGTIVNVDVKGGFFDVLTAKQEVVRARQASHRTHRPINFIVRADAIDVEKPGDINDVPAYKGKPVLVITQPNAPMIFQQALARNDTITSKK
jgi:hypothetical protein